MGRYFNIVNATTRQMVTQGARCWKSYEFCDCHEVAHRLHWQSTDRIFSGCYDTLCLFTYLPKENQMTTFDSDGCLLQALPEKTDGHDVIFEMPAERLESTNHFPNWNGNVCTCCGYVFVPNEMTPTKIVEENSIDFDDTIVEDTLHGYQRDVLSSVGL